MKRKDPELLFELDGPGIHPGTVDSLAFLRLAEGFFRLIMRTAEAQGRGLTFRGLQIRDKCVAAVVVPSRIDVARAATRDVARILRRVQPAPSGTEGLVADLRKRLDELSPGVQVGMRVGKQLVAMRSPEPASGESPWEMTELRVQPLRVSARGKEPTVELASESEALPFTLKLSLDQAKRLGSMLLGRVDVAIAVCRGADGRIVDGKVIQIFDLQQDNIAGAWRTWFADTGDWDEVEDVGAALGRN